MEEKHDQHKKRTAFALTATILTAALCPGHFETTIDPRCDCIGAGVIQYDGITYCYTFVGIPNSVNFYA